MNIQQGDYETIRRALADIGPAPAHDANTPPNLDEIYAPAGHESALDPDRPLVVGGRGVGKSFWAGALLGDQTRKLIAASYPRLHLGRCDVALGFAGVDTGEGGPPSKEILDDLIDKDGFKAEVIWRAIILHCLRKIIDLKVPITWRGKNGLVSWAAQDSERLQKILRDADQQLARTDKRLIIVFDALDRLGDNWLAIRERSKALLRVALAMKSYKAIKPKIFMRIDQAEDQLLIAFPDASKLMGSRVDLAWDRLDLYGLLFSLLSKQTVAHESFARLVSRVMDVALSKRANDSLPIELRASEAHQEILFSALAGPYMGSDRRRGKTYSWVHNHLADAFGRVSPRSFLEAIRVAGLRSVVLENRVVDPRGLQAGLQAASQLRVAQLREEFGWIQSALEPLADLRVPCEDAELFGRWKAAGTVSAIKKSARSEGFLEPVEFDVDTPDRSQLSALLEAMRRIGVAERRSDGRVNVPDIYRVAAKLLRKGGVRPA